jgi:hypothetical protein
MKSAITLDYELYFGENPGTVRRCLLEPTDALLRLARRTGIRLVFFVDAGFIVRMRQQATTSGDVATQFDAVRRQLEAIVADGHDIQLHIHPHWEDSHWDGKSWSMNTRRYRLHAFSDEDITGIVTAYRKELADASGYGDICAYRAGGWALQPFSRLAPALRANGVTVDSSVMPGQFLDHAEFGYDFRAAPETGAWRFKDDPVLAEPSGPFLEIPISSVVATPVTKLGSAISKRFGPTHHATYGDGHAVGATSITNALGRIGRLFKHLPTPVTLDGYKAILLEKAYRQHAAKNSETFVVIGHPKALTPFALDCLEDFNRRCAPETCSYPRLRATFAAN